MTRAVLRPRTVGFVPGGIVFLMVVASSPLAQQSPDPLANHKGVRRLTPPHVKGVDSPGKVT